MTEYLVPIVRREKLPEWHEYWHRMLPEERAAANRDGSLSRTITVRAGSKNDAAKMAEDQNPGFAAILNSPLIAAEERSGRIVPLRLDRRVAFLPRATHSTGSSNSTPIRSNHLV